MANGQLKNKVCIITGAGKGIGRETAKLFYKEGARLALISRDISDLKGLVAEGRFDAKRILIVAGDVGCEADVVAFVGQTVKKFKRVDVLVNNAGMRFRKAFLDITTPEWEKVIDNNLKSVYLFCREVGRQMVRQKQGKIVNIASIVGTLGLGELAAYGASKGGVISLTKCLAVEWAQCGINVNVIAPGFCATSYAENFKKKTELYNFTLDRIPQRTWGSSRNIADSCLFLSGSASDYITGEVLNVDGGWSAW